MNILKQNAPLFNVGQRALDICILLGITWLVGKKFGPPELMQVFAIYGSLILFVVFSLLNMYKSWRNSSLFSQIKFLVFAWFLVLIVFNLIILLLSNEQQLAVLWPYGLFKCPEFSYWALFLLMGLALIRVTSKIALNLAREKGYNQRSAVIVGTGEAGIKLAEYLDQNKWMGITLKGFFDDQLSEGEIITASLHKPGKVIGPIETCPEFARTSNLDMVFIALPMRAENTINTLIWGLGTRGITVYMVPDLFTLGIQKARVNYMGDLPLMDLNLFPGWKRSFDILFSLLTIILTFPLWLLIIAFIKIEDGGPIFYKHQRVMESGKYFNCLKFRSMHMNADKRLKTLLAQNPDLRKEWEQSYKLKIDPRITRVGKFLRKTSLDELPQFINVISGEMSVVGARPIVFEELEKYYKKTALTYCATKPGITGPWQCGQRSDTVDYTERVELDRKYVLTCSLWLDLKIILKTIWRVLRPRGAY